jgi:hypothetical protein
MCFHFVDCEGIDAADWACLGQYFLYIPNINCNWVAGGFSLAGK